MHRSGTLYEDMYWIDLDTMKIVAEETERDFESQIVYSQKTKEKILKYKNLLTIHSHPNSFPPSLTDINSNYSMRYIEGIVVCHDGKVYRYKAGDKIHPDYYDLVVADYLKQGYNECEAQLMAFKEIQSNFKLNVEEVIDNGT